MGGTIKIGNELTPEQDFMLGIMLGYSREQQYTRYLKQINKTDCKTIELSLNALT